VLRTTCARNAPSASPRAASRRSSSAAAAANASRSFAGTFRNAFVGLSRSFPSGPKKAPTLGRREGRRGPEGRGELLPADPAGQLHVEARQLERGARPRRGAEVLDHRPELLALGPDLEDRAAHRLTRRRAAADRVARPFAREEPALHREDVEPHPLVQEADEPRLPEKRGALAVRLLAEEDEPGVADRGAKRLEVVERRLRGVDPAERDGPLRDPARLGRRREVAPPAADDRREGEDPCEDERPPCPSRRNPSRRVRHGR
jgi:hypothetical protein